MRKLLAITVAMTTVVIAGPLMAQSCCSGGSTTNNFASPVSQPIQSYQAPPMHQAASGGFYSTPMRYSGSTYYSVPSNGTPLQHTFPVGSSCCAGTSYTVASAPMNVSTYSIPGNYTYSSAPIGSLYSTSSTPVYSYSLPPTVSSAKSSGCGGCGCGCGKTGSCGCGH